MKLLQKLYPHCAVLRKIIAPHNNTNMFSLEMGQGKTMGHVYSPVWVMIWSFFLFLSQISVFSIFCTSVPLLHSFYL